MAADFMAPRERFLNKIIFFLFIIAAGCNSSGKPENTSSVMVNKDEKNLFWVNGVLVFNQQPFNGTVYSLFSSTADTMTLENYLSGKENGEWKIFYPSGKLKEKRYFEQGKKTGDYICWWENGNKQLHYLFRDDEYEGTCREWNEQGRLTKVMNYKKGHEDGPQQWWYDNGKIKANYIIRNGRRYGLLGTKNCINVSDSIFKN